MILNSGYYFEIVSYIASIGFVSLKIYCKLFVFCLCLSYLCYVNQLKANKMKTTELTPTDSRKSFYGKARIIEETNEAGERVSKLLSYSTIVAEYNHNSNTMTVNGWYSATTARHINSFLSYFGFNTCSKSELENYRQ